MVMSWPSYRQSYRQYALYTLLLVQFIINVSVSVAYTRKRHVKARRRRAKVANRVPEEIWREIFIYAFGDQPSPSKRIRDHEICSCGCNSKCTFGWPFEHSGARRVDSNESVGSSSKGNDGNQLLYTAFDEKIQFALVSRMHWHVASEFLCRTLTVRDISSTERLAFSIASPESIMRMAVLRWTQQVKVDLVDIPRTHFALAADAIACILYCCPGLCSVDIAIRPPFGAERAWAPHWDKIIRHIPRGVQSVSLSSTTKRFDSPILRSFGSLDAQSSEALPLRTDDLLFLQIDSLQARWQRSLGSLTHLYITHLRITPENKLFWQMDKPSIILLHLGPETVLPDEQTAEMVVTGCPSLRFLEYHYLEQWPANSWRRIPGTLERITVKTFEDIKNYRSVLFRLTNMQFWHLFVRHLKNLLYARYGRERRYRDVTVILPETKEGADAWRILERFFRPRTPSFETIDGSVYIKCGTCGGDIVPP